MLYQLSYVRASTILAASPGLPSSSGWCDNSSIPDAAHPPRFNLRDERFASRKEWVAYINLTTTLHRMTVAQADEIIAQIWARLEQARRHHH